MCRKFRFLHRRENIRLIVCLVILSGRILEADGQLTRIVERGRKIIEEQEGSASTTLTNNNNNQNEAIEINLEADDEADDSNDPRKFSWKNHQDDHSIYAHRALLSAANVGRSNLEGSDASTELDDDDSIGREMAPSRRLKPDTSDDDEFAPLKTIDFAEKEWQLMFRSFDLMFDGVSSSLIQELGHKTNLLNEVISRLKPECRRDIDHLRRSVKQHKLWALKMVDSIGKLPSGITYGKFSSPGDYEECLSVRLDERIHTPVPQLSSSPLSTSSGSDNSKKKPTSSFSVEHHKFHGKYCLLDFRLPLPERPKDKLLSIHEPVIDLSKTDVGKQYPDVANFSGYASVFYEVGYMHAVCLPSTCEVADLTRSLAKALEGLHIVVNNTVDCEERPDERQPWRTSQVIAASLIVILFANALFASVVRHYYQRQLANRKKDDYGNNMTKNKTSNRNGGWQERVGEWSAKNRLFADCFSVQSNFERLSKPDPRGLTFVHYTRIVAMALTVITHTAGLGTLQAITKPADASNSEQIFRDFIPQMLANAFTSIQIFFFMAGFMLVISTYPSINRERGHVSFLEYAIKRAIRLMPGLAATICINFLWPLLVDGPMLSYFVRLIVVPCETNWWRTMAFMSNFDHVEKMCLRHSYFSASDYQLHILAFPLLILLYKQPNLSLIIAGILTCAGFVAQVIMILTKTVLPFMMVDYIDKQAFFNVVHYIHHPSWNHMSAFFYGFIIGYLVVKQIRVNLSETTTKRLWYTILPLGIASIFAPYFWNHYKRPIYRWQMVLYVLIDRFALLTACAWLSYASMVLGRKPAPTRKQSTSAAGSNNQVDAANKNLPNTVALAPLDKLAGATGDAVAGAGSAAAGENPTERLKVIATSNLPCKGSIASMTRQRSSPNFQAYSKQQQDDNQPPNSTTLRPAISSSNVHSEAAALDHAAAGKPVQFIGLALPERQPQPQANELEPPMAAAPAPQQREQRTRSAAPISNVNTLCLILSRLTFQLYLFNMVVLWIDVNHSKYYWFFSYYFIITKALSIYICSSLLALVFFVTLESPSLTLYIMWVKSRAQSRADRGAGKSEADENKRQQASKSAEPPSSNAADPAPAFTDHFRVRTDGGELVAARSGDRLSGSSDCLSMRISTPPNSSSVGLVKPTFSYIDLSSPSTTTAAPTASGGQVSSFTGTTTTSSAETSQTKM